MTAGTFFATAPTVSAHDPPIDVPTYAYLAISPNPVGIDQSVFLVMWLHAAPYTADGIAGDRWHDFTIDVTKPDGTTETLGPFISDSTGSTYTIYTPDQLGDYTFDFHYSGQVLSLYHPENGLPGSTTRGVGGGETAGDFIGDTFLPSSATETLTVQSEQVAPVEDYPLPTEYWTRPIEMQNTAWASISSNWLGGANFGTFQQTGYNLWQQGGVAPETGHIVWTHPIEMGGIVGGVSQIPAVGFYSGGSYEGRFANTIIMYGRLYYQEPLGHSNTGGGYTCIDLSTGEIVWHSDEMGVIDGKPVPTFGQLFDYESMNQHGVVCGTLWATTGSSQYAATEGSTWIAYDAFTGKWMYNLTGVPSGTTVYTDKGEVLIYVLDYDNRWMALWNNTQDQTGLQRSLGTGSNAYQWRPNGKEVDMSTAYTWNVTIPNLPGNSDPSIYAVLPGDIIFGRSSGVSPGVGDKFTPNPYTLWAISDNPANRGELLWIQDYPAPDGDLTRRLGPVDPVNRVWTMFDVETMQWLGYSLDNGDLLWGPTDTTIRAYEYYGSGEGGGQRGVTAYGNLYVQGFGGEIFCYDLSNGNLMWKYNNTNSGLDTPWGLRPIFLASVADGKVYAFNNEHSPNVPLYKGQQVYCVDAYTGDEIWTMDGWAGQTGGRGTSTSVLADGFFVYYNYYDGQVYCVGKGASATTVTVSPKVSTQNSMILIEGKVTDISPGTDQTELAMRFPDGVPAVSDQAMSSWMEYLYMQKPIPQDATGVTVHLTATDPNNNLQEIGYVTADLSGSYSITWTPPVEGTYTIVANFEGSEAYYPSCAETALAVGQAMATPIVPSSPSASQTPSASQSASPSPSTAPPPTSEMPTTTYIAIAAAVAVIVIIAAAIMLRRRQ
ncbi:MAG: hypothetical protein NWF04_00235 [Candidatus Bathyarchaeota archaeon]|nr:hypothetical protein [Candidatus Bathyarchaeota archaeon]